LRYLMTDVNADRIINKNFVVVPNNCRWVVILRYMRQKNAEFALVSRKNTADANNIVGIISASEILSATSQTSELYSH